MDCGETDVPRLEFDHEDPLLKDAAVHRLVGSGVAWQRILDEIATCSVRCPNCHQRRTMHMQGSWWQVFHEAQAWTTARWSGWRSSSRRGRERGAGRLRR